LSDLDDGFPGVFGVGFGTVRTLLVCYNKFTFKGLLEDGGCESFFLDSEFDSNSTRVRFRPDESSVNESNLRVSGICDCTILC